MTHKTAYLWGPVSSFSGQLAAFLLQKGWHVHVATKGAFHFALSPLDLQSTAQTTIARAFSDPQRYRVFEERIKYLDVNETLRGTKYDAVIYCGLPPNYDEPRVSRAPWAAENYSQLVKRFKGTPVFLVSSLWAAIQNDGVVPEEIECDRRKPLSRYEAVAQSYENKLLRTLGSDDTEWYLVRLPMMSGATTNGDILDFTGPLVLFKELAKAADQKTGPSNDNNTLSLQYNPDATLWFLPVDVAVRIFWRLLEDQQRPRITNLVSTQTMLNQEWLTHLARALGYARAATAESDTFNLPTVLRKALADNILVKTRGLFEVMGRHQQLPVSLDSDYFAKVIDNGRKCDWGHLALSASSPKANVNESGTASAQTHQTDASETTEQLARVYFTEFLPMNVDSGAVKDITGDETGIAFSITQNTNLDFTLRAHNGHAVVEPSLSSSPAAKVRFQFTPSGLQRLIQRKISLEIALVTREARVEGGAREVLKALAFLKRFMKEHPFKVGEDAAASSK